MAKPGDAHSLMTNAEHLIVDRECLSDVIEDHLARLNVLCEFVRYVKCTLSMKPKKIRYWTNRITSISGSPKRLWRFMSYVLKRDAATTIPPSEGVNAVGLAKFVIDKVDGVRAATEIAPPPLYSSFNGLQLNNSDDLKINDVWKIILGFPIKTVILDLQLMTVLREMIDFLLPFIWTMCSASR